MDLGPLEADLAALNDDLARIAKQPISFGNGAVEALQQIVAEGANDGETSPIGDAFQRAVVAILRDAAAGDMSGNLRFDVDQKSLAAHGAPVLQEAVVALQGAVQSFFENLAKPADVSASVPLDPAPGPGPAPVKVNVDLGGLFASLLSSAQPKGPPKT